MLNDAKPGDVIYWRNNQGRYDVLQILGIEKGIGAGYYCRHFMDQPEIPNVDKIPSLTVDMECGGKIPTAFIEENFEHLTHLPLTKMESEFYESKRRAERRSEQQLLRPVGNMDLSQLLEVTIQISKQILEKDSFGEALVPFAAIQCPDGSRSIIDDLPDLASPLNSDEHWSDIAKQAIRNRADQGELIAYALVYSGLAPTADGNQVNVIRIELEHQHGDPIIAAVPYRKSEGQVEFGDAQTMQGTSVVFPAVDFG